MLRLTFLLLALTIPNLLSAQTDETGFLDRSVMVNGSAYKYQVYVPRDYDSARQWPVILFLHGAGERGTEGLRPAHVGPGRGALRLRLLRLRRGPTAAHAQLSGDRVGDDR